MSFVADPVLVTVSSDQCSDIKNLFKSSNSVDKVDLGPDLGDGSGSIKNYYLNIEITQGV